MMWTRYNVVFYEISFSETVQCPMKKLTSDIIRGNREILET